MEKDRAVCSLWPTGRLLRSRKGISEPSEGPRRAAGETQRGAGSKLAGAPRDQAKWFGADRNARVHPKQSERPE